MPKNASIEKILNQYKKRKDLFEINRENILEALYLKYPELSGLKKEYAALRISQRKNPDSIDYKAKYDALNNKYQSLLNECLAKEKIESSALTYSPKCEKCADTGYVGEHHKRYCSCVISAAAQIVLDSSNINPNETFKNSDLKVFDDSVPVLNNNTQRQLMQRLYEYLIDWTNSFPKNDKLQLVFMGNVGLGKSYLMNALAYETINKGYSTMLVSSFAINEATFDEIKRSDSSALAMMRSVDLLLIDDLGGEQVLNNITCPTLLNILNERIRGGLHTVVSTNLNRDLLEERYGSRIVSRLFDKSKSFVPPIMGHDIRKKRLQ